MRDVLLWARAFANTAPVVGVIVSAAVRVIMRAVVGAIRGVFVTMVVGMNVVQLCGG